MFVLKPRIKITARVLLSVAILFNALAPTGALAKTGQESTATAQSNKQATNPVYPIRISDTFASFLKFGKLLLSIKKRTRLSFPLQTIPQTRILKMESVTMELVHVHYARRSNRQMPIRAAIPLPSICLVMDRM